ncbi:MAG: MFS transporter [Promethearchaeota archaeon]|jgi:MFS family permease
MREVKSNIWKIYLLQFLQGFWFVLPIFILYFKFFNLSFTQISTLEAAYSIFFFIFTIPCGAFSDLINRNLSIFIGTIMVAGSMMILGIGNSYFIFLVGNFIWAIGDGFLYSARGALMYDSVKHIGQEQEYLKISGRANIFSVFPLIISGILGPIMFMYNPRLPWLLMAGLWFLSIFVVFFLVEPEKDNIERSFKNYINKIRDGLKFILKEKHVLWIMMFSVAMAIPLSFFNEVVSQAYYLEIGFSIKDFSIIFPVIYGVASLTASQSYRLVKFLGEKGSFVFIFTIHSVGLVLMGLLRTPYVLIVIIITYISRDFRWVYGDTYINKYADSKIRATILSIISMIISLLLSGFYILGGFLTDIFGIFQVLLMLGIFTATCSFILIITKPRN